MQKKYPFKFLDAYTREDSPFFFGREEEIEDLYQMVFQSDLLLIYGFSGTGKTSLIQCGLASKFQSHDWLALYIRRGSNLNTSLEKALLEAGAPQAEKTANLDWLNQDWSRPGSSANVSNLSPLAQRFKNIYLKHFKPIYLIFDQFEELYILGNKSEQEQFIQTVQEILQVKQPVKIILSIREEYLGYLYDFERAVPELLRKKLRVERMNFEKVNSVLKGVSQAAQSNVRLAPGEEDAVAEGVFKAILGMEKNKRLFIELPYFQMFMDKLYLHITQDEKREQEALINRAALEGMKNIDDVLRDLVNELVQTLAIRLEQNPEQIWKILSPLVTLEGTKEPLSEAQLQQRLPSLSPTLISRVLQAFSGTPILRYSEDEGWYEIAHDSLALQIHERRSEEEIGLLQIQSMVKNAVALSEKTRSYFDAKQLNLIEAYEGKFQPSAEEQDWISRSRQYLEEKEMAEQARQQAELTKARRQLRTVIGLLSLAGIALIVAVYFWYDARISEQEALSSELQARSNLRKSHLAEVQRLEREIELAESNVTAFTRYKADQDVLKAEKAKIVQYQKRRDSLQTEIKNLAQ